MSLLDSGEEEKARKIRSVSDRRLYLLSRILLRSALSEMFGGRPDAWRFITDEMGKVKLANSPGLKCVDFSVSHTQGAAAVAICQGGRVGVDLEHLGTDLSPASIQHVFSPNELALLRTKSGEPLRKETLRLWTAKEAYSKYQGLGFHSDFAAIDTTDLTDNVHLETHEIKIGAEAYQLAVVTQRDLVIEKMTWDPPTASLMI